jgi:hypothetical protein
MLAFGPLKPSGFRVLDNLPVATVRFRAENDEMPQKTYERGFPVGFISAIEVGCIQSAWPCQHLPKGCTATARLLFMVLWRCLCHGSNSEHQQPDQMRIPNSAPTDVPWAPTQTHALQEGGENNFFLYNHLRFSVLYNLNHETDLSRIVGFEVEPYSVKHTYEGVLDPLNPELKTCAPSSMVFVKHENEPQLIREGEEVIFTYDVLFRVRESLPPTPAPRAHAVHLSVPHLQHTLARKLASMPGVLGVSGCTLSRTMIAVIE